MTTTDHPLARIVEHILRGAAVLLEQHYQKPAKELPAYGLPEAVAVATEQDTLARILAQRTLVHAGLDVWWSDLVCRDGAEAAAAVRAVVDAGVDFEAIYGPRWEAIVGLIKATALMDTQRLCSLGFQLSGHGDSYSTLYESAFEMARAVDRWELLLHVTSDVQFAGARADGSPATLQRRLLGIRVIELAAAFYVLEDALDDGFGRALMRPILAGLFPESPRI